MMEAAESSEASGTAPDDDDDDNDSADDGDGVDMATAVARGTVLRVFIVVCLVPGALLGLTVLCTSWFTDVGLEFYGVLESPHPSICGQQVPRYSFALGVGLVFLCYLTDIQTAHPFVSVPAIMIVATVFSTGALFMASQLPTIPVAFGMCVVMMSTDFLRWRVFGTCVAFFYGAATAFVFQAMCLAAASTIWMLAITQDSVHLTHLAWTFHVSEVNLTQVLEKGIHEGDLHVSAGSAVVLCTSPLLIAFALLVMAAICFLRARFHAARSQDIGLIIIAVLLLCVFVGAWLAASLAATGTPLADLILEICVLTFAILVIYILKWFGLETLEKLVKENPKLQTAVNMLTNDITKGLFLLAGAPLLPLYAAVEVTHEAVRSCIRICSCTRTPAPSKPRECCRCLTAEGDYYLSQLWKYLFSDITPVVSKSMYIGMTLFLGLTSLNVGLPYFLVWFNGEIKDWSLTAALLLLFTVEMLLFLFPPISGPVLYIFASVVIFPKVGYDTTEKFWTGVACSTLFCWILKLAATGMEQKAIGVPFSSNLRVKMLIRSMISPTGVRAMREIFNKPGWMNLYKVFLLCGGADWPTSVLTGILDLPIVPMLVGTLPVVLLILPCCAAGGFLLRSASDPERENEDLALFGICGMLGQGGQVLVAGGAAYAIQKTLEDHQEELNDEGSEWQRDPQEDALRDAEARAAKQQAAWLEQTSWALMPLLVKIVLVCGWICAAVLLYLVLQPETSPSRPFRKFALTDTLPEGGLTELINAAGYVCLYLFVVACVCTLVFQLWCCRVTSGRDKRHMVYEAIADGDSISGRSTDTSSEST